MALENDGHLVEQVSHNDVVEFFLAFGHACRRLPSPFWPLQTLGIAFPYGTRLKVPLSVLTPPMPFADRWINE